MGTDCRSFMKGMLDVYKTLPVIQLRRFARNAGIGDREIQRTVDKMVQSGAYEYHNGILRERNLRFTYAGITADPMEAFRIEKGIHKAFVVFMDFVLKMRMRILTHFPSLSYPYIMVFATEQYVYEVMYAEDGKEGIVCSLIDHLDRNSEQADDTATKRIVIVDSAKQTAGFAGRNIELFAVVDEAAGKAKYIGGDSS